MSSIKFDILTLFPEMFSPLDESMVGRARKSGLLDIDLIHIRDYSTDKHKKTDDTPFGGGPGMVMMADPLFRALRSVESSTKRVIYMSPRGRILDKELIQELAEEKEICLICGHYEGVDQRVLDHFDAEEVSIGDFVLTGGELPAMVLIDSVARMIPGVLSSEEAALGESVYSGLLEYPQYTKPRSYEGMDVPDVLTSGDHEKIRLWQFEKALELTKERRPDLLREYSGRRDRMSKKEKKIFDAIAGDTDTEK